MHGSGDKAGCRNTGLKDTAVTLETEQSEPEAPAGGRAPRTQGDRGQNGQDMFTAGQGARRMSTQGNRPSRSLTKAACRGLRKGHSIHPGLAVF